MGDHAGELLWKLYAIHRVLNVQGGDDILLGLAKECCDGIGKFIRVAPPSLDAMLQRETKLIQILDQLGHTAAKKPDLVQVSGGGASSLRPTTGYKSANCDQEVRARVDAGVRLAEEILANIDDIPEEGAGFAESVQATTEDMLKRFIDRDFCSEKQLTAIENMHGGVEKWIKRNGGSMREADHNDEGDDGRQDDFDGGRTPFR